MSRERRERKERRRRERVYEGRRGRSRSGFSIERWRAPGRLSSVFRTDSRAEFAAEIVRVVADDYGLGREAVSVGWYQDDDDAGPCLAVTLTFARDVALDDDDVMNLTIDVVKDLGASGFDVPEESWAELGNDGSSAWEVVVQLRPGDDLGQIAPVGV